MDGEQQQRPITGAVEDPTTTDAVEIALEALSKEAEPPPLSPARLVLLEHRRLLRAQTAQLGRERWRDIIVTLMGLCVLAIAAAFLWDASRASGVVVEPFTVTPELEQRLSGPVLASQLLDKLTTLQAQTESLRAHSTYANDWSGDIKVEIPNTGVSIGEQRRYLRAWLGRQTRLSGEVYRLPSGKLVVTTRVGANPGTREEGDEAELDAMLQKGAEAIYAETQPYRYAVWLARRDRVEEAQAIHRRLIAGTDLNDRLWGYNGLANTMSDIAEKHRLYRAALKLRPDFAPVISNRAVLWSGQGQEEQAYHGYGELLANAASARRELEEGRAEFILNSGEVTRAALVGDMRQAAVLAERRLDMPAATLSAQEAPLAAAAQYAQAHDMAAARRMLADNGLANPASMAQRLEAVGPDLEADSAFAMAIGDWPAAAARLERVLAELRTYEVDLLSIDSTGLIRGNQAMALARAGRIAEARAAIAPTALDCAPCVRARGLVEAYAGDPRAADNWLSKAAALTPSLPVAHNAWAEAYLVRHDPAGAIVQAKLAVEKGPKWAEPRKAWGDALMMQGKPDQAARKYREALKLAPGWGDLHLALGRAEAAAGRRALAQESYRAAASLDLNAADRASVTRLLAGR